MKKGSILMKAYKGIFVVHSPTEMMNPPVSDEDWEKFNKCIAEYPYRLEGVDYAKENTK